MTISTAVPVTISPEAATRIASLRIQRDVQHMIEHAGSALPELDRIEVHLYDRDSLGDEPGLCIDLYSRRPYERQYPDERQLIRWLVRTFPPEILQHVILDYHPGQRHAG